MLLALLVLIVTALAHVPHDNVTSMAIPQGLDASQPWIMVTNGEGKPAVMRSEDAGYSWESIASDALMDTMGFGDGGMTPDGTAVFLSDEAVWFTPDGGDSWEEMPLPAEDAGELWVDDRIYVGGDSGLYSAVPGGSWRQELTTPVKALGPGPSAVVAGDRVLRKTRSIWRGTTKPSNNVSAVAGAGVFTYAGTTRGEMWVRKGTTWSRCGNLPITKTDHPGVLHITTTATKVLVATAEYAPYTSDDHCATWSKSGGSVEQAEYEASGGVNTDPEAYTILVARGNHYVVAGWTGFWESFDAGVEWREAYLTSPAYMRSVAYSPLFPDNPRIWYGPRATGVIITDDGGATVDAPSHDLKTGDIASVWSSPDPDYPDIVFTAGRAELFMSTDAGVTWDEFATDLTDPQTLSILEDPTHVWVLDGRGASPIVESFDTGESWTPMDEANTLMGTSIGHLAVHFTDAEGVARSCIVGSNTTKMICTEDGGVNWELVLDTGAATDPSGLVAWPPGAVTRILYGDVDGFHYTDDLGAHWSVLNEWGRDGIVAVDMAVDGTLFAGTESGRILRSMDGGDTWDALDGQSSGHIYSFAPRPDWDDHQDVLVATQDGPFQINDALGRSPVWRRWCDVERVDNASAKFVCDESTGCLGPTGNESAGMFSVQMMTKGAHAHVWLRGTRLRVIGLGTGVESVRMTVDGVDAGTLSLATDGVLLDEEGFSDDQHLVEFFGDGEGDVAIDAVEGWRESEPLDMTP